MKTRPFYKTLITTAWLSSILLCSHNSIGQKGVIELKFTAINGYNHVQLDSIYVLNRNQGGDTVLYWPDTILSLYVVGIDEINKAEDDFQIFQNYPNPVIERTTISLFIPEKDQVALQVTDATGRVILKSERILDKGIHSFMFTPGGGNLYFFTTKWRGINRSIKIMNMDFNSNSMSTLEYTGFELPTQQLKTIDDYQDFHFSPGDELLYNGYVGSLQSGALDNPEESQTYSIQFATNIPCPGTPTVEYEGQVYNSIQIFNQCWLKENLNVGTMIPDTQDMVNNGIVEKYCLNNNEANCDIYGGLYFWTEMMQYNYLDSPQGICPSGWHIPSNEEYKILEGAVDSEYGIGNPQWDIDGARGFDAGLHLKSLNGWEYDGNGNDLFGFTGLPSGARIYYGYFVDQGINGYWWSSTSYGQYEAFYRDIFYGSSLIMGAHTLKNWSYSVRCLKD